MIFKVLCYSLPTKVSPEARLLTTSFDTGAQVLCSPRQSDAHPPLHPQGKLVGSAPASHAWSLRTMLKIEGARGILNP